MTRSFMIGIALLAATAAAATPVEAACSPAGGKFIEHILSRDAAPNDPAGRVVGNVDGTLQGAMTAFITSLSPARDGGFDVGTYDAFATDAGNILYIKGSGRWTFIKNGFYQVQLTLTIVGGSGAYAGATGTLTTLGVGNNVGPGSGEFVQEYTGQICTP